MDAPLPEMADPCYELTNKRFAILSRNKKNKIKTHYLKKNGHSTYVPNIGTENENQVDSLLLNLIEKCSTSKKTIKCIRNISISDLNKLLEFSDHDNYTVSLILHPNNFAKMESEWGSAIQYEKSGKSIGFGLGFKKIIVDDLVPEDVIYSMPTCEFFGAICYRDEYLGVVILAPKYIGKIKIT